MRPLRLVGALVLAAVAGCGGDDAASDDTPDDHDARPIDAATPDAEELPSPLPTGPVDGQFLTYNIGMIQTVKGAQARLPHVIAAIEASGADVVCLQEVYTQYTSPSAVAAELADVYPHAMWDDTTVNNLSNGLLIVSKVPLYRKRFFRYTMNDGNNVVDRAVLAATAVDTDWYAHVLCTHIQAGLDPLNTSKRRDQLEELADFADDHGYTAGPAILLGDFNAGPDPDPLDEECPNQGSCPATCTPVDTESIAMMETTYGWTDRADDLAFTECTYCKAAADSLAYPVQLFPCEGSQRIDHCFTRGLPGGAQITAIDRTMDQTVSIDLGNGMTAEYLSDHFGVQCTIAP